MFDRHDWGIMRLSASANGTYVFDDYKNGDVIRISTIENGQRQSPVALPEQNNSRGYTAHPFIAPDESYLIWDSKREDGFGDSDLYTSFRQHDGSGGAVINVGEIVNSDEWDTYATVPPDGTYILFNREVNESSGNVDIYWIDAVVIKALREKADS